MVNLMANVYGPDVIFYGILLLSATLGFSQAKLCALLSPDSQTAFIYFALLISFEMILSGFLIFPEDAPDYLKWTMDIMFTRWAVYGLLYNQFNNFKENGDITNGILNDQGELVLNLYGLSSFDILRSLWILGVYLVGLEVLVIISMLPKTNRLKLMTSSSDSSSLQWNIEEGSGVASGTSQSLQIDLLSNSNRETLSSRSFFDRFSIPEVVSQVTPHLIEPYNRMTASSSQHDSQVLTSEGRLVPRLTHTEPRDSCRVSDLLESHQRAELLFRNVTYTIKGSKTEEVQLLHGISGVVRSGELCAIMGSSGAGMCHFLPPLPPPSSSSSSSCRAVGKTTLLNVLYGRINVGCVGGEILVNKAPFNGMKHTSSEQPRCAYVMQDDAHIPVLTIKETLTYAAMLRMREISPESTIVKKAVEDTIELLGLKLISGSYIGTSQDRNISLGQLRRVTIGVEIVHRPSLIFLDEPTSGLDSYLASTVVDGLHTLSRSQRTLCCTIHQPSAAVFEKFDKLLLLCNGYPLYFGPIPKCRAHFETFALSGEHSNPAEFVISVATILSQQSRESTDSDSLKQFSESSVNSLSREDLSLLREPLPTLKCESNASQGQTSAQEALSVLQTAWILTRREVIGMFRRRFWIAVTLRSCLFGVFLGLPSPLLPSSLSSGLLWRQSDGFLSVISFFFASFIATCVWVIEIVPGLHEEKIIFYRERAANATSTFASWVSMGLPTILMSFVICVAFSLPAYYLSGLRPDISHFVIYLLILYLGVVIHITMQYLCAAMTPNAMIHTLIFNPF
jgi:ABC-type multidrug transport system ATPase subunit